MKKDVMIMSYLRRNSRESLTSMSRKIKIPISTIYDRLKIYESTTIMKYTSLLDFGKLGFMTRANIALKTDQSQREELREFLMKHKHVNSLFKINNGFDFMADVVFRHVKDLEDFMEQLEARFHITGKQVYYVIQDIKREEFMSNPDELGLIDL